jgi:hypothetical protein
MKPEIHKAIEAHVSPPPEIEKLGRLASWDLLCGPLNFCEECGADRLSDCTCSIKYPGFEKACAQVAEWSSELSTLYYEIDSDFLSENEPEGFEDEESGDWVEPEPYYTIDRKDIVRAVFGKDLAEYL